MDLIPYMWWRKFLKDCCVCDGFQSFWYRWLLEIDRALSKGILAVVVLLVIDGSAQLISSPVQWQD